MQLNKLRLSEANSLAGGQRKSGQNLGWPLASSLGHIVCEGWTCPYSLDAEAILSPSSREQTQSYCLCV